MMVAVLALAGCDKVYFAHIDVGSPDATVGPLSPDERDTASAIFRATATELGLHCAPTKYSIIMDSYNPSVYELHSCRAEGQFTDVQLAQASDHLTVEVHQIAGLSEPAFFAQCRSRFVDALQAGVPSQRVRVQYPYHWGTRADHRHK
jgi:hypothetical protein